MPSSPTEIHQQQLAQLAAFIQEHHRIDADWDAYHDEHADLDDLPHDEHAYNLRADKRNADSWRAFNRVRRAAAGLLATADAQIQQLPSRGVQSRWVWQVGDLSHALDQLDALQEEWTATRDELAPSARPGTPAYDAARAERNASAWQHLSTWASAGDAIAEINRAAHLAPSPLTTRPPTPVAVQPPAPVRR
ncbi:hypothetical protein ACIBK8_25655 [Streptomyces sp. NPDC050161]|uniref:hypothetical protein n=1 Tax=Streptomyces sp. NPDC050161 TaxID=3365604 RepID=UPI00378C5B81